MGTVRIIVKNMQASDYSNLGVPITLRPGDNEIDVLHWLNLRNHLKTQIEGGFVSVDDGEAVAIESFKQDWFIRFESLGAPSVEAATESGELSKGALKQFATEWLLSKEESRKDESLSISRKALAASVEANSLAAVASRKAERANNIAIMAIICSAAAALIAAWITVKFGK